MAVTTVLLTYHHATDVAEALASILEQDLGGRRHQVLVVDDASTDGTLDRVRAVLLDHPQAPVAILAGRQNVGMQRNLRRALEAAEGEYVALLEGDDRWTAPDKLAAQLAHLDGHPEAVAVGHLTRVLVDDEPTGLQFAGGLGTGPTVTRAAVLAGSFPHLSSLVFRRAALPSTPSWFDDLAAADWPMVTLLAEQGEIGLLRRELSDYRKNDRSSWTPRPPIERKLRAIDAIDAVRRHLGRSAPELRRHKAELHLTVVVIARRERRPALAVQHAWRAVVTHPTGVAGRVVRRVLRRPSR